MAVVVKENHAYLQTPSSVTEARAIQEALRHQVKIKDSFSRIKTIAGIDVGYDIQKNISKVALVVMDINDLKPTISITDYDPTPFPYIPGLLSFREAPVILKALSQLKEAPDLIFIDGHGIAHPRSLGIAAHIGVLTGLPTIGVAKSVLCGSYREPSLIRGSVEPLVYKNQKIGTVLRTKDRVKPVYVSPGNNVSHETAVKLVLKCSTRYRLPEPTRLADKLSKIGTERLV